MAPTDAELIPEPAPLRHTLGQEPVRQSWSCAVGLTAHRRPVTVVMESVDDEGVAAVMLTDEAAGNVQRFQLEPQSSHIDSQLFGLMPSAS
jgi:hypothetical protein